MEEEVKQNKIVSALTIASVVFLGPLGIIPILILRRNWLKNKVATAAVASWSIIYIIIGIANPSKNTPKIDGASAENVVIEEVKQQGTGGKNEEDLEREPEASSEKEENTEPKENDERKNPVLTPKPESGSEKEEPRSNEQPSIKENSTSNQESQKPVVSQPAKPTTNSSSPADTNANENTRLPLKAICKDGAVSYQDNPELENYRGMCSGHGGISQKLGRVK